MSAAIPDYESVLGTTINPPEQKRIPDPTPSDPDLKTPDQKLAEKNLTKKDQDNLMSVRRIYKEDWSQPRRLIVQNILRKMEYLKGNQYYVLGPDGYSFVDPFANGGTMGQNGNQSGNDGAEYYRYVNNIIQWFERVLVSTLSSTIPAMRYQPTNAQSDIGTRLAEEASRANAYIERLNDEKALLQQKISYLSLAGSYFVYVRPVRDERLSGNKMEPKVTEQMQDTVVKPNRYLCRNCNQETPLDQMAVESELNCKFCNKPVSEADFHQELKLPMPVIKEESEVPQMQVRKSIYNGLCVDAAPYADSDTGDPLVRTPILDLSLEIDLGALRAMYPAMWKELAGGGDASGAGDNEVDRLARLQQFNQNNGAAWFSRSAGIYSQGTMPTYSRTWLQPEAFNRLDDQQDAARLNQLFPKGCCVSSWGGQFLDVRDATLSEEWTWGGTRKGFGLYPPAILDPAMDFQDRINDAGNTESEYYDRMAVPGIAYDSKAITGKGLNGKYWPVGAWFPVPVKSKEGRKLQDVLFQPEFHMDAGIKEFQQRLIFMAQMVVGVTPQTYGGGQSHIDTKGGQEQALKVAMGILWLYWEQVRSESARTAQNAIRCLADNATQEVFDIVKGDDNRYKNQPIDISALKNEVEAYPEEEQGYPESRDAMADRLMQLLEVGKNNPLVMEMLQPMKNRRIVARTLLPADIVIPQNDETIKVQEDIARLMQGAPTVELDPDTGQPTPMPSVKPDPDLTEVLAVTQETVQDYLVKNYYPLVENSPQQFENIKLYMKLAAMYQRKNEILNAPPQPPPPGQPTQ